MYYSSALDDVSLQQQPRLLLVNPPHGAQQAGAPLVQQQMPTLLVAAPGQGTAAQPTHLSTPFPMSPQQQQQQVTISCGYQFPSPGFSSPGEQQQQVLLGQGAAGGLVFPGGQFLMAPGNEVAQQQQQQLMVVHPQWHMDQQPQPLHWQQQEQQGLQQPMQVVCVAPQQQQQQQQQTERVMYVVSHGASSSTDPAYWSLSQPQPAAPCLTAAAAPHNVQQPYMVQPVDMTAWQQQQQQQPAVQYASSQQQAAGAGGQEVVGQVVRQPDGSLVMVPSPHQQQQHPSAAQGPPQSLPFHHHHQQQQQQQQQQHHHQQHQQQQHHYHHQQQQQAPGVLVVPGVASAPGGGWSQAQGYQQQQQQPAGPAAPPLWLMEGPQYAVAAPGASCAPYHVPGVLPRPAVEGGTPPAAPSLVTPGFPASPLAVSAHSPAAAAAAAAGQVVAGACVIPLGSPPARLAGDNTGLVCAAVQHSRQQQPPAAGRPGEVWGLAAAPRSQQDVGRESAAAAGLVAGMATLTVSPASGAAATSLREALPGAALLTEPPGLEATATAAVPSDGLERNSSSDLQPSPQDTEHTLSGSDPSTAHHRGALSPSGAADVERQTFAAPRRAHLNPLLPHLTQQRHHTTPSRRSSAHQHRNRDTAPLSHADSSSHQSLATPQREEAGRGLLPRPAFSSSSSSGSSGHVDATSGRHRTEGAAGQLPQQAAAQQQQQQQQQVDGQSDSVQLPPRAAAGRAAASLHGMPFAGGPAAVLAACTWLDLLLARGSLIKHLEALWGVLRWPGFQEWCQGVQAAAAAGRSRGRSRGQQQQQPQEQGAPGAAPACSQVDSEQLLQLLQIWRSSIWTLTHCVAASSFALPASTAAADKARHTHAGDGTMAYTHPWDIAHEGCPLALSRVLYCAPSRYSALGLPPIPNTTTSSSSGGGSSSSSGGGALAAAAAAELVPGITWEQLPKRYGSTHLVAAFATKVVKEELQGLVSIGRLPRAPVMLHLDAQQWWEAGLSAQAAYDALRLPRASTGGGAGA